MRLHFPFPRHNQTAHIQIDAALCEACKACIATCPHQVLGLISFLGPHRLPSPSN